MPHLQRVCGLHIIIRNLPAALAVWSASPATLISIFALQTILKTFI
jgi:hypothetical protein